MDCLPTVSTIRNETFAPASTDWAQAHAGLRAGAPTTWKRVLDLTCICLALPVLVPLMLCIAAAIKLTSPGPVFFKQERVGHRRAIFLCYKFRSMQVGTDAAAHQQHVRDLMRSHLRMTKLDGLGDSRLIPGAAILRATGLDELPQVFNIWRGEMSLVGPRPCMTYELDGYQPAQYARFDTLPGLTGLWQVSGKNRTTFDEMVELDIRYAQTKSLWSDVTIMAKTFAVVVEQVRSLSAGRPARRPALS